MISGFTGRLVASLVIISTMVLLSVLLDSVQEYRAEQAAEQLKVSVALAEREPTNRAGLSSVLLRPTEFEFSVHTP